MKVYLVEAGGPYGENVSIDGIYSSLEKAQAGYTTGKKGWLVSLDGKWWDNGRSGMSSVTITEYELDDES